MDDRPVGWGAARDHRRRTSAVDYVLADLREAVGTGALQIGERLPSEAALATRYSVSRTVIREVLRACEAVGLTVTRSGKGTFVVADHPSDLVFEGYSAAHLMEARPGIEVPAAALAALRRTDDQLEVLRRVSWDLEHETDDAIWGRLDASFHLLIAEASGNPVFADVIARIAAALTGQSELLNVRLGRRAASLAEHRAITGAIARGASTEAEDAMRYHLQAVRDAFADSMTTPPAPGSPAATRDVPSP